MKKRRLFVGGLPWIVDDAALKKLFEEGDKTIDIEGCGLGSVEEAAIVRERETGRSRGFAFITMSSLEKADEAVTKFNGILYQGRHIKVDEAADQGSNRREGGFQGRQNGNRRGFSN